MTTKEINMLKVFLNETEVSIIPSTLIINNPEATMTTKEIKWQVHSRKPTRRSLRHIGQTTLGDFHIFECPSKSVITKAPCVVLAKDYKNVEAAKRACHEMYQGHALGCKEAALARLGN